MSITRLWNTWPIAPRNLYEAIVGEAWTHAASGVRQALTPPLKASGTLRIVRAHRGIAGLIARMILLPPEGEAVEASLELRLEEAAVRWNRRFGAMNAESVQTFLPATYVEQAGPFRMEFRIEGSGNSLAHVQVGTRILGIPAPRFCGPTVEGLMGEGPDERSWRLRVDIRHGWFGSICRYEGVMRLL